ncbi:MAG: NHLP bacteriocin system secretion protein [Gemmatimonadales bacterium]|nr:NHLP bacteriocin system secretion protein [Gemmatimonadales bacterium]
MDTSMFRPAALQRLLNPERLDTLMQVTSTKGWIGLGGLGAVLIAAIVWGFLGRLPDTVSGRGVILREGGLYGIQALGQGPLIEMTAPLGSRVDSGQVVARIAQPQLDLSIRRVRTQLEAARANRADIVSRLDRSTRLELATLDQQRRQLEQSRAESEARISYLDERVRAEEEALELGLITGDVYQATVAQRAAARDQLISAQVQLEQLAGREVVLETENVQRVFNLDAEIRRLEGQLALEQQRLKDESEIRSPYVGVVVEHLVDAGEAVNPGQMILNIELLDRPFKVFLFAAEGKRILSGMRVQLLPDGIRSEEFGFIIGTVRSVSQTPLSPTGMNRVLRNDALVSLFRGSGGAHLVEVEVELDPTTASGFRWTTRDGPDLRFGSGTVLYGTVTVRQQAPITLVIPKLREWLGV